MYIYHCKVATLSKFFQKKNYFFWSCIEILVYSQTVINVLFSYYLFHSKLVVVMINQIVKMHSFFKRKNKYIFTQLLPPSIPLIIIIGVPKIPQISPHTKSHSNWCCSIVDFEKASKSPLFLKECTTSCDFKWLD